jgi:hypothetical protein
VFRRMWLFLRVCWLAFGAALLALALFDAGLRAVLKPPKMLRVDASVTPVARESMAANSDGAGYWREHDAARDTQWRSYVYFRRKPFQGRFVNVDAHGFRVTVGNDAAAPALWLFGGSTVWGTGVSDAHTLASELVLAAGSSGVRVGVENFGETGYVSAQSQLAFMAALRCGATPKQAVFVDGVNDVYAAFQSGAAGMPQNESNRSAEFNVSRSIEAFGTALLARLKGISLLRERLLKQHREHTPNLEPLALGIAQHYLAVVAQTRAMSAARGIQTLFVWQPSLFDKRSPTADEQSQIAASFVRHRDLQLASTRALKALLLAQPAPDVLVLDQLYANDGSAIYLDFAHTGARGNALLAARIWQELSCLLVCQGKQVAPQHAASTALQGVEAEQGCVDRPVAKK